MNPLLRVRVFLTTLVLSAFGFALLIPPAEVDPIPMVLQAGGGGPGPTGGRSTGVEMAGSFFFDPSTASIYDVILNAQMFLNGNEVESEYWPLGRFRERR